MIRLTKDSLQKIKIQRNLEKERVERVKNLHKLRMAYAIIRHQLVTKGVIHIDNHRSHQDLYSIMSSTNLMECFEKRGFATRRSNAQWSQFPGYEIKA